MQWTYGSTASPRFTRALAAGAYRKLRSSNGWLHPCNTNSSFWRAWLKPEYHCLVPVTSFCEYTDSNPKVPHWFALGTDRPLFAFARMRSLVIARDSGVFSGVRDQ